MKPYQISQQSGNATRKIKILPKKPRTTAAMMYPWAVERNAAEWLSRYFEAFGKRTASELLAENGVALTLDASLGSFGGIVPDGDPEGLETFAGLLFDKINEHSLKVHTNHFVKLRIENMGLPDTAALKTDFVKTFVDRCVTSGTDQKHKIAEAIYNFKTMRGSPVKELREQIQDINNEYSDRWAAFIARNEIGNLNEAVSRAQAEAGGFDMYEWLATQDEAVRSEHEALNGLICRYDDGSVYSDDGGKTWKKRTSGMYHGEPGTDYNCRCCGVPFAPDLYQLPPDPATEGTEAEKAEHAATTAEVKAKEAEAEAAKLREQLERLREREAKANETAKRAAEKADFENARARNLATAEKRHAERTREQEIETQLLWDLRRKERGYFHEIKGDVRNFEKEIKGENKVQRELQKKAISEYSENIEAVLLENLTLASLKALNESLKIGYGKAKLPKLKSVEILPVWKGESFTIAGFDGGYLYINSIRFNEICGNRNNYFKEFVTNYNKKGKLREFAIDKPEQVGNHIILHEIGHYVFKESKLENKIETLKKLKIKSIENGTINEISLYAKNSEDIEDLFAEIFAIFCRGGTLPPDMEQFINEAIK